MRVYLSGRMRGEPLLNAPMFHDVARVLRALRYQVFNPAETWDGADDLRVPEYADIDAAMLRTCEAVFQLPGCGALSQGVAAEEAYARWIGKPVLPFKEWKEVALGGLQITDLIAMSDDQVRAVVHDATEGD